MRGAFMTPESRFGGEEFYLEEHPSLIHSEETMHIMRSLQPDIIIRCRCTIKFNNLWRQP